MRYVSKSVMTGFVNALAILIFWPSCPSSIPETSGGLTYALVPGEEGLAIIYLFPGITTTPRPRPLVTITVC